MRSPESRARDVAERLGAVTGTEVRTTRTPGAIRVEVDVPAEITTESLLALVDALGAADRYGHDRTPTAGVAWAEITRLPPGKTGGGAADDAVRDPAEDHQGGES